MWEFAWRTFGSSATCRRHERRKPEKARSSRDTIKDRAAIPNHPANGESRAEAGYGEGDLIICKRAPLAAIRAFIADHPGLYQIDRKLCDRYGGDVTATLDGYNRLIK